MLDPQLQQCSGTLARRALARRSASAHRLICSGQFAREAYQCHVQVDIAAGYLAHRFLANPKKEGRLSSG